MPEQQQQPFGELRQNFSMFIGLCQIISKPLEPWLRRPGTWGERHVNHRMMLGWLFALLFSLIGFRNEDQTPMYWFLGLTVLLLILHRFRRWRRWKKGYRPHSLYGGRSWLTWRSECNAKCNNEPTFVWMVAILAICFSVPLGGYLFVSGSCLFFAANWQREAEATRLRQMRDHRWEQEYYMQQMQEEE
jgi:hypothetical protein